MFTVSTYILWANKCYYYHYLQHFCSVKYYKVFFEEKNPLELLNVLANY